MKYYILIAVLLGVSIATYFEVFGRGKAAEPKAVRAYEILQASNHMALTQKVQAELEKGYTPVGGITIDKNGFYYQALMK